MIDDTGDGQGYMEMGEDDYWREGADDGEEDDEDNEEGGPSKKKKAGGKADPGGSC